MLDLYVMTVQWYFNFSLSYIVLGFWKVAKGTCTIYLECFNGTWQFVHHNWWYACIWPIYKYPLSCWCYWNNNLRGYKLYCMYSTDLNKLFTTVCKIAYCPHTFVSCAHISCREGPLSKFGCIYEANENDLG